MFAFPDNAGLCHLIKKIAGKVNAVKYTLCVNVCVCVCVQEHQYAAVAKHMYKDSMVTVTGN